MELKETVSGMLSDNVIDRLEAEYNQAHIRACKLKESLEDRDFEKKVGMEEYQLLKEQYKYLDKYLEILGVRLVKVKTKERASKFSN